MQWPPLIELRCASYVCVCAASVLLGACGVDTAAQGQAPDASAGGGDPLAEHPAYVEHLAAIFQRKCAGCHGGASTTSEARNCVRIDRWDSAADPGGMCSDPAMAGQIFGVRDAATLIVDNIDARTMPRGSSLSDDEIQVFQRWRDDGFPKRAVNQPPTIELSKPPPGGATVCENTCSYTIDYATHDPDDDSIRWSLGWAGGGQTGVFASGLSGGSGTVAIDATPLGSGTYMLTATLDDGTAKIASTAAGVLTVAASHNAAPAVTVTAPNGGESYANDKPIAVSWTGSDPDDAMLTYDVAAVGATRIAIQSLTAPVGPAGIMWTPPKVTAATPFRIEVTARDKVDRPAKVTDLSDAEFVVAPPQTTVSFSQQIQPILTSRCTSCHGSSSPDAGLRLSAGASYGALVGVASGQCASFKRVTPGQPDASYLVFKLDGAGPCYTGSRMPRGAAALSAAQRALIRDWIAAGAPNN